MNRETYTEKTKVCALNLCDDVLEYLKEKFDVYEGTLGKKVDVSKANIHNCAYLLFNGNFPDNIQEYEVFVEDMLYVGTVEYEKDKHIRKYVEGSEDRYFASYRPQTIFNPIPFGSHWLQSLLGKDRNRPCIKVVFLSEKEEVEYIIQDRFHTYNRNSVNHSNYEHIPDFYKQATSGSLVRLCDNKWSKRLFEPFLNDIHFDAVFETPITYKDNQRVTDEHFLPLLESSSGAVVSFVWLTDKDITFALPQTNKKKEILQRLFEEILFRSFSDYFPEVKESAWLYNKEYFVPGKAGLLMEKAEIQQKYEDDMAAIDKQINENQSQYEYLHTLLRGTGDELVEAMIVFLKWLGFENVINRDTIQREGAPLEEDIDVDLGDDGLLVIEVKGIGGTSTDAQCSQIHKIVHRRSKERNRFDVKGLYIVNNEMHVEPLHRMIPPFNATQIKDAENDERGLAYSWQFFNLYFNIENGFITKDEARNRLLGNGLIIFEPDLTAVGVPYQYYKKGTVACIEVGTLTIKVGNYLCFEINGRWQRAKVLSIQKEHDSLESATNGKFGFGLDMAVPKNKMLYLERQ